MLKAKRGIADYYGHVTSDQPAEVVRRFSSRDGERYLFPLLSKCVRIGAAAISGAPRQVRETNGPLLSESVVGMVRRGIPYFT